MNTSCEILAFQNQTARPVKNKDIGSLPIYSLHTQKIWFLGQRHGLQNTILTSYFSKNIYQKVIYIYIYTFIKVFFKTNLFIYFLYFQTQKLESYIWFIFSKFDSNLILNVRFFFVWSEYGASTSSQTNYSHSNCLVRSPPDNYLEKHPDK